MNTYDFTNVQDCIIKKKKKTQLLCLLEGGVRGSPSMNCSLLSSSAKLFPYTVNNTGSSLACMHVHLEV